MRRVFCGLILAAAMGLPSAPAHAAITMFDANLDGLQEVPPNAGPGFGTGTLALDDVADTISVTLDWNDLTAGAIAAHIHTAPTGVNGPVTFPLALGSGAGTTSGSIDPSPQSFAITPAQIADLEAGKFYMDVHTSTFPGGEIRGQLAPAPVPEPGSFAVFSVIAACVAAVTWRRRRLVLER